MADNGDLFSSPAEQATPAVPGAQEKAEPGKTDDAGNVAMFSRTLGEQSPVMQALSENDEIFAIPRLTGKTVTEIAFDLDPAITVLPLPKDKGRARWRVTLPDGGYGDISIRIPNKFGPDVYGFDINEQGESVNLITERAGDNPDDVFIDVS